MTVSLPAKVSRCRIQLMLRHSYLASATARLKFRVIDESWCPTMATDGFNIFINPNFVESQTEEETIGVMAHEVMHCILGHADRRGNRIPEQWNLAIDFATNLILSDAGVTLPSSALLDWSFKGLTAEDIYNGLSKRPSEFVKELSAKRGEGALVDVHLDSNDQHGQWARARGHPTEAERRRLRKGWNDELKSKLPGKISGDHSSEIEKSGRQEIDWRAFLSHFMTGLRRDDYRIFPANKKHLWRGIYLPSFGSPGPDHIVVAIDTSGSMDPKTLGKILVEIDAARQIADCKLTVIQCDVSIKSVTTFEAWELSSANFEKMNMRGRGGTSLIPPFDWMKKYVEDGNLVPDALIYMTDGYGPSPSSAPMFPCLWVVPQNGSTNFPFGDVVTVDAVA
jgi:predicted metal-dependent peptidase